MIRDISPGDLTKLTLVWQGIIDIDLLTDDLLTSELGRELANKLRNGEKIDLSIRFGL